MTVTCRPPPGIAPLPLRGELFQSCENQPEGCSIADFLLYIGADDERHPARRFGVAEIGAIEPAERLRKRADRFGDLALRLICLGAALLGAVVLILIAKEVIEGASPRSPSTA